MATSCGTQGRLALNWVGRYVTTEAMLYHARYVLMTEHCHLTDKNCISSPNRHIPQCFIIVFPHVISRHRCYCWSYQSNASDLIGCS